jgi:hypothetical protein
VAGYTRAGAGPRIVGQDRLLVRVAHTGAVCSGARMMCFGLKARNSMGSPITRCSNAKETSKNGDIGSIIIVHTVGQRG